MSGEDVECIICYETFEQLASVCTDCPNAHVCARCMQQWRAQCMARRKDVTCPKCRRVLERRPRITMSRSWLVTTAVTGVTAMQSGTGRALLKSLVILGIYCIPIMIMLFCLSRIIVQRIRTPWLGVFIAMAVAYLYHAAMQELEAE